MGRSQIGLNTTNILMTTHFQFHKSNYNTDYNTVFISIAPWRSKAIAATAVNKTYYGERQLKQVWTVTSERCSHPITNIDTKFSIDILHFTVGKNRQDDITISKAGCYICILNKKHNVIDVSTKFNDAFQDFSFFQEEDKLTTKDTTAGFILSPLPRGFT